MRDGAKTREAILKAGVELAELNGLKATSRAAIARKMQLAESSVDYYFKGSETLRNAVKEHALKCWSPQLVAEAILSGTVTEAPRSLCKHICDRIMAAAK